MKPSFKHLLTLALFSVLGIGAAVYAYTGPNRTRTEPVITCKIVLWECQKIESKDRYSYHKIDDWSCSSESKPWKAYPSSGPTCQSETTGKKYWSREERVEEIPVTYPPAEISAQPLCSLPGQNGWCRSGAVLQLSGYEPVAGYAISAIEGLRSGENFALAGQTVNVAAVEGQNNFEYWAHSTFGDTSLKGASTLYLDSQPPTLNVELNGTSGNNAWLKSAALSASASDPSPGSGLGGLDYTLDGSNWIGLSSPASLPDGIYNLQVRASDLAGNTGLSQASEIKIDSLTPTLNVSESGTGGANGWYISTVQVSAAAQDGGSGLAALDVSLNGSAWTAYLVPIPLADGSHSLSFWAEDLAGWVSQETRSIRVDTQAPTIGGQISGTSGTNGWYTTNVTVTALASDPAPASGIETFTYALNGNSDQTYSAPLALTDGQHNLILSARDQAGLETNETLTIRVDTIPPALEITSQYPEWVKDSVNLAGTASDGGSGLARIEASFDGGKTWQLASGTSAWSIAYDTRHATSGRQTWYIRAVDLAGQTSLRSVGVPIDNTPPRIDLPGSWSLWETVTFDAWDGDSGLANAELVISDPQNRWPKRVYSYQPGHLPLSFQWDRRLGDGTLAPLGDYDVSATATDRMGNTRKVTASISISLGEVILVPPTATPLGAPRPTATPTITPQQTTETAILSVSPTPTSGSGGMAFGATAQPGQPSPTTPASSAPPRATPTESPFSSWIGSLFTPSVAAADSQAESSDGILWGAGALAAMAGMTAYYEQKRREEEEAKRAAVQAQFAAEQAEKERQQKAQAKSMAKLEQQWAEERRKEQAYLQWKAEQEQRPDSHRGQDGKLEREENKEEAAWEAWKDRSQLLAAQRAEAERQKQVEAEKQKQAREDANRAYAALREKGKSITVVAPKEQPWWGKAGELWNKTKERVKAGSDVLYNLSTAIGAVEIARQEHFLKDTQPSSKIGNSLQALWGSMTYQAEKWNYDWEKVQTKIADVRGRTAVAIQQTIESGKDWRVRMNTELKAHWTSFGSQTKMTWDAFRRNGLDGLNVKTGSLIDFSGSVADIGSAIGYAGYAVTGNESWRTAAQWADVASVPAAVRQVATNLKPAAQFFTKGPAAKGVSFLGKVAGPLAILTGGFTLATSIPETITSIQEGDTRKAWANGLSAFSGAAAVVGGAALLIPGAQPVAAVALGLSAITGVASMAVEYWPAPSSPATPVDTSLRPPTPPISTPVQTGTPTPPSTSIPTLTPTPPMTNTPSQTPQVTQTPAPTQNQIGGN